MILKRRHREVFWVVLPKVCNQLAARSVQKSKAHNLTLPQSFYSSYKSIYLSAVDRGVEK